MELLIWFSHLAPNNNNKQKKTRRHLSDVAIGVTDSEDR